MWWNLKLKIGLIAAVAFVSAAQRSSAANAYKITEHQNLSDTGLYESFADKTVAAGIKEFTPRFPLFSNSLVKRRFVFIPAGESISFQDLEVWRYPVGFKVWKEFAIHSSNQLWRVETRYIEKTSDGWAFGAFVWSTDQTAAKLWSEHDGSVPVAISLDDFGGAGRHAVPAFSQCILCHDQNSTEATVADAEPVLGLTSFQLERSVLLEMMRADELEDKAIPASRHRMFAATPEEYKVTGYLHGNCGHCHNQRRPDVIPGGGNREFLLNYNLETTLNRNSTNIIHQIGRPFTARSVGLPDLDASARLIKAGSPRQSMIYRRMLNEHEQFRMPLVGISDVDDAFVNGALRTWITRLPATP